MPELCPPPRHGDDAPGREVGGHRLGKASLAAGDRPWGDAEPGEAGHRVPEISEPK